MKWIGFVAVNIALFAAIGYFVHRVTLVSERRVPLLATERTTDPMKPVRVRRTSPPQVKREAAASCAAVAWPNPNLNCIGGSAEASRSEAPGGELAHSPGPGRSASATATTLDDPMHTGSISKVEQARRKLARKPTSRTREARMEPVTTGRAPRRVRMAAQPRRSIAYYEAYARKTASLPWWSAAPAWGDERGGN